jgi:hypothetical protein
MKTTELKSKLDFYVDALYQKGYDFGYECALEELDLIADKLWNSGMAEQADAIRIAVGQIREELNG